TAGPVPVMSPYSPGRLTGVLNCSTIQHGRGTAGPAGAGPLSAKVGGGRMAMAPTDVSRLLDDLPPDFDRQRFAAVYAEAAGAAGSASGAARGAGRGRGGRVRGRRLAAPRPAPAGRARAGRGGAAPPPTRAHRPAAPRRPRPARRAPPQHGGTRGLRAAGKE